MMPKPIEGVLIDIAGVLYVGDEPVKGAAEALGRLQKTSIPIRFLTNTTRSTRERLLAKLRSMGFDIEITSIFSAPIATRKFLERHRLRPYLLVHPDLLLEFAGIDCDKPNAVVVGDAGDVFQYRNLNQAFRILMNGGALISMGSNRYFREKDGLSLDMGPFVEALRFASAVEPIVVGKPTASFFQLALDDMGVSATQAVMIGDDLENDVGGAQAAGLRGILVRTGKFRAADEDATTIKPDLIVDDVTAAVVELLKDREKTNFSV